MDYRNCGYSNFEKYTFALNKVLNIHSYDDNLDQDSSFDQLIESDSMQID